VKAATSTTRFTFSMVDADDDTIYEEKDIVGVLRDSTSFFMDGIYTWTITSDTDEGFTIKILIREGDTW